MTDEPQRRGYERRRWPDERIDDLAELVRAFGPTVTMVATHQANIDEVRNDVAEFKIGMADLEARLCARMDREAAAQSEFRKEYRENREKDAEARQQREQSRRNGSWVLRAAWVTGGLALVATESAAIIQLIGLH